ncbi:Crp/Fnr family transcriptional regulator [Sphingomonas sp. CFBP8993]|uniref:Crp/Fnr family transcriptional regulator n=1 Tax=Sphingomonas sp. CFBP8993 TaxID=3096526 RepID=UPI002A6AC9AA|nr:Crp/Fnr family transcriptional regulator [Sphingomonas sp. CFBP8993]MDY0957175.1 Crp/Fnr family transcriptional regulator [Sphingomonas sp. CFBP8993]
MSVATPADPRGTGRALSTELLLYRLRNLTTLASHEIELVLSLGEQPKPHAAGTSICPHEDCSPHPRLIVGGWACRPRILPDGRRQMLGLLLPGDMMGDRGERRPLALNPVVALTPVRTIGIGRLVQAVRHQPDDHPGLVRALAAIDRGEEMGLLDHIVRLGCQNALQRVSHLLLELHQRLSAIGFVHAGTFPMPLTQDTLAELLGLSLVHINRIVSQLRREKLVTMRSGIVMIADFPRLALLADRADPTRDSPAV